MSNLTILLGLLWLGLVSVLGTILLGFDVPEPTRTRMQWALAALFTGPIALALWTLERQKTQRRAIPPAESTDRSDATIAAIDEEIEAIDAEIDAAGKPVADSEMGGDMMRRLQDD